MENRNEEILNIIRQTTGKLLYAGQKACRDYLIALGIYNEDGTLHKDYGGEPTK